MRGVSFAVACFVYTGLRPEPQPKERLPVSDLKTKPTDESVTAFLDSVEGEKKREDFYSESIYQVDLRVAA